MDIADIFSSTAGSVMNTPRSRASKRSRVAGALRGGTDIDDLSDIAEAEEREARVSDFRLETRGEGTRADMYLSDLSLRIYLLSTMLTCKPKKLWVTIRTTRQVRKGILCHLLSKGIILGMHLPCLLCVVVLQ